MARRIFLIVNTSVLMRKKSHKFGQSINLYTYSPTVLGIGKCLKIRSCHARFYNRFQLTVHCNIPNFRAKLSLVRKLVAKFKSSFQNLQGGLQTKVVIGPRTQRGPIKCLVYKPAGEF